MSTNVEFLVLPGGRSPAEEFLEELDDKTLAKVYRLLEILKKQGSLPFPHARKMTGLKGLWELRVLSREIDRAMQYLQESGAKL